MDFNLDETIRLKLSLFERSKHSLKMSKREDFTSSLRSFYREEFHLYFNMYKKVDSYFRNHSFIV